MKRIRVALGVIILIISLSILIWSVWPAKRETRVLPISPTEMTLPTPQSHHFDCAQCKHFDDAQRMHFACIDYWPFELPPAV